jgi:MauM/NapG family ferredoxin protein
MRQPLWIPWRWWRRAAQLLSLLAFFWLFRRTEYSGVDQLAGGENIFFRLDPLVGAAAMLAARHFIALFWPAMVLAILTVVLGRFFCGWICPLGSLLDYFQSVLRPIKGGMRLFSKKQPPAGKVQLIDGGASPRSTRPTLLRTARYVLLITILLAAGLAYPLVGLVDPFSLLLRGLTFWADPMLFRGAETCFGWFSDGWVVNTLQPFVKTHLLPFRPMVFQLAGASAALLAAIFAMELIAPRFWCRYVCPAGAMLGLLARWSLVKRIPAKVCKSCADCVATCRMNALDRIEGLSPADCTLCMDCVDFCPKGIAKFGLKKAGKGRPQPVDLSRRGVLAGIAAGVGISGAAVAARQGHQTPVAATLLRPPGAADEKTFLNLCIRCGECMKVCPTNVLQPAIFQAGLEGVFSPHLVPRYIFEQTYCEYMCTLCGQVCPTGAIPRLDEEAKHARPIGKAYFDHSLCLPWAEKTPCIRCEEMCPVPDKAIKILDSFTIKDKDGEDVEIQRPHVDRDLCVGCGICESACTIEGTAAIRVQRVEAPDPRTETLLKPGTLSG